MIETRFSNLPVITQIVLGLDYACWDEIDAKFQSRKFSFLQAVWFFGSYARMEWAVKQLNDGKVSLMEFNWLLPNLWAHSDPDDTHPAFLKVWRDAFVWNKGKYLKDDEAIRLPSSKMLDIYRGQLNDDGTYGISWSLSYDVAKKFAKGAWYRCPVEGIVFKAQVPRSKVMGYMTGRNEAEVIVDPSDLVDPVWVTRFEKRRRGCNGLASKR
jgi:hypothetical protein